jgi:hypothetical protein
MIIGLRRHRSIKRKAGQTEEFPLQVFMELIWRFHREMTIACSHSIFSAVFQAYTRFGQEKYQGTPANTSHLNGMGPLKELW